MEEIKKIDGKIYILRELNTQIEKQALYDEIAQHQGAIFRAQEKIALLERLQND